MRTKTAVKIRVFERIYEGLYFFSRVFDEKIPGPPPVSWPAAQVQACPRCRWGAKY
jgi:hypothetical protein